MFSAAQYEAAIKKISSGLQDLNTKVGEIVPAAKKGVDHWYVPSPVQQAVIFLAKKLEGIVKWIINKITEVVKGALAPLYMFFDSQAWSNIQIKAEDVAGVISEEKMGVRLLRWQGPASESYGKAVKPQGTATSKIAAIADSMRGILQACAIAGLVFYIAVGVILVKFISAVAGAIASFGTVIASWYGVAVIIEEAGSTPLLLLAALSGLAAVLAPQIEDLNNTRSARIGNAGFDNGIWPIAVVSSFGDATVKDGDGDWSVKPA